jgi:hypothetical protein
MQPWCGSETIHGAVEVALLRSGRVVWAVLRVNVPCDDETGPYKSQPIQNAL